MNYKEIIDNLDTEKIEKLLYSLGAQDVKDKGDYLITQTICHNEDPSDASDKLYYYKNSHTFVCYTECGAQSIFKFLQHYYETREMAYDWRTDILEVARTCTFGGVQEGFKRAAYKSQRDEYEPRKIRKDLPEFSPNVLKVFSKAYPPEWLSNGISRASMDKYNILYSISQNKIIIPHYDVHGRLVGIRGRALDEWEIENVGKYMPVQIEQTWYSHPLSLNLYGLNISAPNIKKYGICYIGESEKFCMQMDGFSFPNCAVAVCGSQLNKYHIDLLMRYCAPREIVVCFDSEEKENENTYFKKLWNLCSKYKNYCNISFVYDRHRILKLKDSPTDCGEEIFKTLVKERVKIK